MTLRPLAAAVLAVSLAAPAPGQSASGSAPAEKQGLDSLPEDAVLNELAGRNLEGLLNREFELQNTPDEQRKALMVRVALGRLGDPSAKLTEEERDQLLARVAREIGDVLPAINDPKALMEQASLLIQKGLQSDVQRLEYWGPSEAVQGRLRPVVEAVVKLLEKTGKVAGEKANAAAEQIKGPGDKTNIATYDQMNGLAQMAGYTRDIVGYYLALATDPADPRRAEAAKASIDDLKQFDTDENPDRNFVRTVLGKLQMATRTPAGFDAARKRFDEVINNPAATPNLGVQFDARLNRAVVEILAGDSDAAQQQYEAFEQWLGRTLPNDPAAAAVAQILDYRVLNAKAAKATDDSARKAANEQATAVLLDLIQKRPDLQDVIYEQLLPKIDESADLANLDPLLLKALMGQGQREYFKADGKADVDKLARAVAAARELERRKGQDKVSGADVEGAAFLAPFLLQKLDKPVEAASAYLDYAKHFASADPKKAETALNNAQVLVGKLRETRAEEPAVVALYERLLPLAIDAPFGRRNLAFAWGYRLKQLGKPAEAAKYFAEVPAGDPNYETAQFFRTVSLAASLPDLPKGSDRRKAALAEVQRLADQVRADADRATAATSDPKEKLALRSRLVGITLLAAGLARTEQGDPARAVQLLDGFEQAVAELPNATSLMGEALLIRVQGLIALGKNAEATDALKRLLDQAEGQQALNIVLGLFDKLSKEYDAAAARGDKAAMAELASNRAALTPFLVDWAKNSKDPDTRKLTYRYSVIDAETQRIAANLAADPAKQKQMREAALARFKALEGQASFDQYQASLPDAQRRSVKYDPAVNLNVARLEYDLGDFGDARTRFANLLQDKVVGNAVIRETEAGQVSERDNDLYWEVVLKFIRSNVATKTAVPEMKAFLRRQYVLWGGRVGGTLYKPEYEALRKELLPDFNPDLAAEPATMPVAAG